MNSKRQTCAACKFQRKRCSADCLMAPHFPANKSKQFLNAHKLFGVGKLTKMVGNLPPHLRVAAMVTATVEAEHRAKDPVGGCYGVVVSLMGLISQYEAELHRVRSQIFMFRGGGDGGGLPELVDGYKYNDGFEHGLDSQFHLQKSIGQYSQDHGNVGDELPQIHHEHNVFDLRDEVVLKQDGKPIQDEEHEERDIKGMNFHSQMVKDEYELENTIVQEDSNIVEQLVPQPHQEESNVFGSRDDEAVLDQDVKPMQYLSDTSAKR